MKRNIAPLAAALLLAACASVPAISPEQVERAAAAMKADDLVAHIRVLSSDDFEGRSPGTHGEELTVDYLVREFKALGLSPGNPDGTYIQRVPLVEFRTDPHAVLHAGGKAIELRVPQDLVAFSAERKPRLAIHDSPLVFAGYGVIAPEYGWDDFKGMDVRGKTLVVLVNDPQIPDPKDPAKLDEAMFKGNAMTYYGRWTYKYEIGVKLGAAAVIIVHEEKPASYPYAVVMNSFGRENFAIRGEANDEYPPVASWIHVDAARRLFAAAGLDFDAMKKEALKRDFRPVPLGTASFDVASRWRELDSRNVVARIEGSDPKLRDEYVVYTAHWDHFGWDPKLPGTKHDQVYHGAIDNASGTSSLLLIAKAFKALPVPPARSILFVEVTGEERGLLGSQYYASHPLYPLDRTLAAINIDGVNAFGRTSDLTIVGMGHSALDDMAASIAATQGRSSHAEAHPEAGGFFRGDHLSFVRVGVPAVAVGGGQAYIGKPADYAEQIRDTFIAHDYHKPTDVLKPDYDFSGAMEDLRLLFRLGLEVADGEGYPAWKPSSEFQRKTVSGTNSKNRP